jgi:hypothetical protein
LETGVSAIVSDVNGNPVADGTQVFFGVKSIEFDEDRNANYWVDCYRYENSIGGIDCPGDSYLDEDTGFIVSPSLAVILKNNGILGIDWFSEDVNRDGKVFMNDGNHNSIFDPKQENDTDSYGPFATSEDKNDNGIIDYGEDRNGNGILDPPQGCNIGYSAITTGGVAKVQLNYPMSYAANIKVRISAEANGVRNFYEYILLCTKAMTSNGTCGNEY